MSSSTKPPRISPKMILNAAEVLKCIGHPVRLKILELLEQGGERTVSEIHDRLDINQPKASQHLGLMRDRGILASRRDGVNVYYRIQDEKVVRVLDCLRSCDL